MNHQRKPELWKHLLWNDRVSSLKSFKTVYLLLLLILCSVFFFYYYYLFFWFVFFFSFCLRRASSITWASQTPNQWLIDCPSSRHGHTSVSLTATKKKQEYKLGFTVWWRAKEQIIDNHDTNLSLILKKTLFYCLPWFPIVPCLVSVDIGME